MNGAQALFKALSDSGIDTLRVLKVARDNGDFENASRVADR